MLRMKNTFRTTALGVAMLSITFAFGDGALAQVMEGLLRADNAYQEPADYFEFPPFAPSMLDPDTLSTDSTSASPDTTLDRFFDIPDSTFKYWFFDWIFDYPSNGLASESTGRVEIEGITVFAYVLEDGVLVPAAEANHTFVPPVYIGQETKFKL